MKLLNAQQIHAWDAYTIAQEPIASWQLMERAAQRCTTWIIENIMPGTAKKIFCGKGNNGGDGLAIARQLMEEGFETQVYILEFGARGTDDFQMNLVRLHERNISISFIQSADTLPEIAGTDIVIDALFGSGLNRPLTGISASVVEHINQSGATVISIDVPSGMFIDKSSAGYPVIKARNTLTFQTLKLCFLVAENAEWCGQVNIMDISLKPEFPELQETTFTVSGMPLLQQLIKPRTAFSHKGSFGHALLIAGNTGKMGAAVMAARSCLRTGAGLLSCNIPKEYLSVLHISLPEAMAVVRGEEIDFTKFSATGIGPGLGTGDDAVMLVKAAVSAGKPLVADADALNIIAKGHLHLQDLPGGSIITPHPKEFDRLAGSSSNDFERMDKALEMSTKYSLTVVLKGHNTLIAHEGKGWFNTTGNPGMATGGSGDVLTGMITSLLAQKYASLHAAIVGVFLHGLAADLALEQQSEESLLPTDIIEHIGKAYNFVEAHRENLANISGL